MSLTTTPTPSPAILDIIHDGKVNVGKALHDIDGFWKYCPSGDGWFEAHNLRQIADLLDGLNAPYSAEIKAYFDSLPKEIGAIDSDYSDLDTPF
jgi:hypothetical protein